MQSHVNRSEQFIHSSLKASTNPKDSQGINACTSPTIISPLFAYRNINQYRSVR